MMNRSRRAALCALATAFSLALFVAGALAQSESTAVPILVYHRFGPAVADSMTVTTRVFADQLAWLRAHDYRVLALRSLLDALSDPSVPLPARAVVITIDDGHETVYTEILPLIRRDRLPVTLFIYPSAISNASYAMTWDQVAELAHTGLVDVQSHTYWHPNFQHERARLTPDAYREFVMMQLNRSKDIIARHLGATVDMLAWPFGIHDPELESWATAAGYRAAFTLERRSVHRGADVLALPRYLITDGDRGARFAAIVEGVPRQARP